MRILLPPTPFWFHNVLISLCFWSRNSLIDFRWKRGELLSQQARCFNSKRITTIWISHPHRTLHLYTRMERENEPFERSCFHLPWNGRTLQSLSPCLSLSLRMPYSLLFRISLIFTFHFGFSFSFFHFTFSISVRRLFKSEWICSIFAGPPGSGILASLRSYFILFHFQGFGRSQGDRNYVRRFQDYIDGLWHAVNRLFVILKGGPSDPCAP